MVYIRIHLWYSWEKQYKVAVSLLFCLIYIRKILFDSVKDVNYIWPKIVSTVLFTEARIVLAEIENELQHSLCALFWFQDYNLQIATK
jgi:hypothetical protein